MSNEFMKITSVTPALPGWVSVFEDDDGGEMYMALAVWAVVEDEHGSRVVGMAGGEMVLLPDTDATNFLRWEYNPTAFEAEVERQKRAKQAEAAHQ